MTLVTFYAFDLFLYIITYEFLKFFVIKGFSA